MSAAEIIDLRTRRSRRTEKEIVAVVLSDGTVRDLRDEAEDRQEDAFTSGQLSADGWTLWWERRAW